MIRCKATGEEHKHETVTEVKACYDAKYAPKITIVEVDDLLDDSEFTAAIQAKEKAADAAAAQAKMDAEFAAITATLKPQPVTEPGIYRKVIKTKDAELTCIYRVKMGKSGFPYAEALVLGAPGQKARFVFQKGLIKTITADMRMTKEQAIEYGVNFGICCRCGKVLTKDKSVEKGIGPVCIKKF